MVDWIERHGIETRPLLGGNILKHPAYKNLKCRSTRLDNTNMFHENSFYIGCYPGITKEMADYIIQTFEKFFRNAG